MKIKNAEKLALRLIKKYCPEYSFGFTLARSRFGSCYYAQKKIFLSKVLVELNNEEVVKNIILHEIAHALTPYSFHDRKWVSVANSIGCDGKRNYGPEVVTPKARYIGTCPKCERTIERNKRSRISCGQCNPLFSKELLFKWTKNE